MAVPERDRGMQVKKAEIAKVFKKTQTSGHLTSGKNN